MIWFVSIIAILIGVAMLFWGYRLFRIWLAIVGLLLGAEIGNWIGSQFGGQVWPIVLAIAIGLAIGCFAFFFYRIGAVITGAFLGAALAVMIFNIFHISPYWWMYLIGAVPGAFIAGILVEPYIKIASAYNGALLIISAISSLINGQQQTTLLGIGFPWYLYIVFVIFALIGIITQFKIYKGKELNASLSKKTSETT